MELLSCPVCDSDKNESKTVDFHASMPMGIEFSYKKLIHVCLNCGEKGTFSSEISKENHKSYLAALDKANNQAFSHILEDFTAWDYSLAHIERALRLPQRTISRWKANSESGKGGISAAGIALLRIVHTYPWMLKVADNNFEKTIADNEVISQSAEITKEIISSRVTDKPKDATESKTNAGSIVQGNFKIESQSSKATQPEDRIKA